MKFRAVPGNPALMSRAYVTHGPGGAPSRDPDLPYDIPPQDRLCGDHGANHLWSLGAPSALALGRNR